MRTSIWRVLVVSLGLLTSARLAQAAEAIRWTKSFAAAMSQAKSGNKMVMVEFYTTH
jgi:hypothetical protein